MKRHEIQHQGKAIEKVYKESGVTIAFIAKKMGLTRPTVYKIFGQQVVKHEVRKKLSEILKHDFLGETDDSSNSKVKKQEEEIRLWKDKYLALLEEYNSFLKDKSNNL